MRDLDALIELAKRHVEAGREIVARQRDLIASGRVALGAAELLEAFERSQAIFEDDLARFLKERDRK
jgi:hypothetical protein